MGKMSKDGFAPFSFHTFLWRLRSPAPPINTMKKFLMLFIALLAMTVPTEAQNSGVDLVPIPDDKVMIGDRELLSSGNGDWTPPHLTSNHETFINVSEVTDDECSVSLYDKKLDKVIEITYPRELAYKEWWDSGSTEYYCGMNLINIYNHAKAEYNYTSCYITQTLFNDDSNYEFIVLTPENDWITESLNSENNGRQYRKIIGCKIMNDQNVTLSEIKFKEPKIKPSGYTEYITCNLFEIDDYTYLEFEDEFFLIDRKTSSLKRVEMPKGLKAVPGVARRDMDVKVEFEASATERLISLVDANGRTVKSNRIPAGTNVYNVNTGTLASGLYIVTLSDGASSTETAKIIIR